MTPIFCPFCQIEMTHVENDNDVSFACKDCEKKEFKNTAYPSQYFIYSILDGELEYYQINIELDGELYGYDSYANTAISPAFTEVLKYNDILQTFLKLDFFTPLPKSRDEIEHSIRRILNLKAFL
jgi:hypothetical protein